MGSRHLLDLVASVGLAAGLAVVLGSTVVAPPAWAAEPPPPEPVLVVPSDATDGQVRVRPATQAPDERGRLTWLLANGGEAPVTLALQLHEVVASDGRLDVGPAHPELDLLRRQVQLAPGEAARVRVPVPPDLGPGTVALVARGADEQVEVTGLALVGSGGGVQPSLAGADVPSGTVTVRLAADGPALVDVAVRATVWPGLVRDEQVLADVLVPAGGRDVPVAMSGPVAGRVTFDVAVSGPQPDQQRASAVLWWWPRELLVAIAAVLLVATVVVLAVASRHRRRDGQA